MLTTSASNREAAAYVRSLGLLCAHFTVPSRCSTVHTSGLADIDGARPCVGQLVDAFDVRPAHRQWEDGVVIGARTGEVLVRFRHWRDEAAWYPSEGPRCAELLQQWGTRLRPRQPYKPRAKAYWEGRVRGTQFGRTRGQAASAAAEAPAASPAEGAPQPSQEEQQPLQPPDGRFAFYLAALRRLGLEVAPMGGDGNCLFRSVAHQAR